MNARILLWELLCIALFWGAFCRSVYVDKTTRVEIRAAVVITGLAALTGLTLPLYGWAPDNYTFLLISAFLFKQIVTSRGWANGVPTSYHNEGIQSEL